MISSTQNTTTDRLFHKPGLVWFWIWNDECDRDDYQRQIDAFADSDAAALVFHPRSGLEIPYLSDDWFELIRWAALRCQEKNVDVWLYDEDYVPSGSAGGRVAAERPELYAKQIEQFVAPREMKPGEHFDFPIGELIWAGLVNRQTDETVDLTSNVGIVRRDWQVLRPWNSRFFYADTPLYDCPRAWTSGERYSIRIPEIPEGFELVGYSAQQINGEHEMWEGNADSLNPASVKRFIELTHDRYVEAVGDLFGSTITAMFTDEPKIFSPTAWTRDLAEDFQQKHGYDIRQRVHHLFGPAQTEQAMTTLLHYRQWCAARFESAWLKPIADWCNAHNLPLVGHISPEDDPIPQAWCVGDLMPIQRNLAIPGTDLIIPAVGDRDHPCINVGTLSTVSIAQQQDMPGAFSETMGCSGETVQHGLARRIMTWQTMMGITTTVVHGAWSSMEGNRAYDAPPDLGPKSEHWDDMKQLGKDLAAIQSITRNAKQVAPVALIWPVRTFQAANVDWLDDTTGLRAEFLKILSACLDNQVGIHLIDEKTLDEAQITGAELATGRARYAHVIVPPSRVIASATEAKLQAFAAAAGSVHCIDALPKYVQQDAGIVSPKWDWCTPVSLDDCLAALPRLVQIDGDATDIRCTVWQRDEAATQILLSLHREAVDVVIDGKLVTLHPDTPEIKSTAMAMNQPTN